ncbi:cation transporter [Lactobacillus sp. YT155]|uniref:heavy-metal-associated domain-containing protein n=1 Tax=Lactobacillus sp. YT155 TaxID=3060955 RepID=UPI0026605A2C|nr:cation transporter [Lactobacillus sp. YT155]MDO1604797.1 cation transporter [Lactobacillus sp. YT155]
MKIIMQLDELSCPSCLQKIEAGVGHLSGVNTTKVLFNASKVKVDFNESLIDQEKLIDTVTNLGYEVKEVKVK